MIALGVVKIAVTGQDASVERNPLHAHSVAVAGPKAKKLLRNQKTPMGATHDVFSKLKDEVMTEVTEEDIVPKRQSYQSKSL